MRNAKFVMRNYASAPQKLLPTAYCLLPYPNFQKISNFSENWDCTISTFGVY